MFHSSKLTNGVNYTERLKYTWLVLVTFKNTLDDNNFSKSIAIENVQERNIRQLELKFDFKNTK